MWEFGGATTPQTQICQKIIAIVGNFKIQNGWLEFHFPTTLESNVFLNFIVIVNDEHNIDPILKIGVYQRSRGCVPKNFWRLAPRPPFFAGSARVSIPFFMTGAAPGAAPGCKTMPYIETIVLVFNLF